MKILAMTGNIDFAARFRWVDPWVFLAILLAGCGRNERREPAKLVQVGGMHESIGKRQHQGRVHVADISGKPHFYGVGALEALKGELTFFNSVAVMTTVTPEGLPRAMVAPDARATLIVGQSVERWTRHRLPEAVSPARFDETIGATAGGAGMDLAEPFVFVIEGQFADVRLHVINGACPIHARMNQLQIAKEEQPFEWDAKNTTGTLVGVYAVEAVGRLTHPATTTHTHLIYDDPQTGERVTGHVERVGLAKGAILKLPMRR